MPNTEAETITIVINGDAKGGMDVIDKVIAKLTALKTATGGKQFSNLSQKLENIQKAVDGIRGEDKLRSLAESMEKLKQSALINFGKTPERLTKLAEAAANLAGFNFDKLRELAEIMQDFRGLPNINIPRMAGQSSYRSRKSAGVGEKTDFGTVKNESRTVEDVGKKAEEAAGRFARFREVIANTKRHLSEFGGALKQTAGVFAQSAKEKATSWALGDSSTLASLAAVQPELAIVIGLVEKLGQALVTVGKAIWNVSKAVITLPFKMIGNAISKIYGGLSNLVKMAKKRIMYRALNTLISGVQKGFTDGIYAVYEWSRALSGDFAKSMDTLATAGLYFKNSIGAMVAPLINALAPAIDYVVDKCVDLINVLNQVFAILTGADTWTKALKYPYTYEEAANKASKAAKALKKSVLGIDELNQLKDNTSGSGGRSGDSLDYSKMFEEQTVTSKVGEFFKNIKDAITNGNFSEVGTLLGEKLNTITNSVDKWFQEKGPKVTEKLKNFATTFNSFGASVEWESVGSALGSGFNTALDWIWTTITEFDWVSTATHLTSTINGFIGRVNWTELGQTISTFVTNTLDWFTKAVTTFDWDGLGRAIGQMLKNIDWVGIKEGFKALFGGVWEGIKESINGVLEETGLKEPLTAASGGLLFVLSQILHFQNPILGTILDVSLWKNVGKYADSGWKTVKGIWNKVSPWFKENVWSPIETDVTNCWDAVKTAFQPAATWFSTNIWSPIRTTATSCWEKISSSAKTSWANVKTAFQPATAWFSSLWGTISTTASTMFYNIGVFAQGSWDVVKQAYSVASGWFDTNVLTPIKTKFSEAWENIKTGASTAWTNIKTGASQAWSGFAETISPLTKAFSNAWGSIKKGASEAWEGIKTAFKPMSDWFKTTFGSAWEKVKSIFSVDSSTFTTVKTGIENVFSKIVNWLIDGLNNLITKPFNAINELIDKLRNFKVLGIQPFENLKNITVPVIPKYSTSGTKSNLNPKDSSARYMADGGFLNTGEFFVAREAGPELVGSIGNRTAVANNDQIVEGIAQGVSDANEEQNALLREQNNLLRAILGKEGGNTEMSAQQINATLALWNRRVGMTV